MILHITGVPFISAGYHSVFFINSIISFSIKLSNDFRTTISLALPFASIITSNIIFPFKYFFIMYSLAAVWSFI